MIRNYKNEDRDQIIGLWNHTAVQIGYKEMDTESFSEIFTDNPFFCPEHAFVMAKEGHITGFACGCTGDGLALGEASGYVACVILDGRHETEENYKKLMDCLEGAFLKEGKRQSELLFFDPIMLPWYIKGTPRHEHNNAPGVFKSSRLYWELLKAGYKERTTECAMYLELNHYTLSQEVRKKIKQAELGGYEVSLYNKNKHHGLKAMLQKLGNPLWEKEILQAVKEDKPFLVAAYHGKTVGFAGPVSRQSSGRGYFAGIGVDKEYEGHGLGTILFNILCQEEEHAGALYMSLYTGTNNPAKNIYLQAGFRVVEEFAVMRKMLKPDDVPQKAIRESAEQSSSCGREITG